LYFLSCFFLAILLVFFFLFFFSFLFSFVAYLKFLTRSVVHLVCYFCIMEKTNYPNNVGSLDNLTVELEQDDVASLEVAKRSLVSRILCD
jgi:hypothetical protein